MSSLNVQRCANCGREYNADKLRFCPKCGGITLESEKNTASVDDSVNNFCRNCGSNIGGARYCGSCGRDSYTAPSVTSNQRKIDVTQSGVDEARARLYESKARNLDKGVKFITSTINGMAIFYVLATIASLVGSYLAIRWAINSLKSLFGM